MTVKFVRGDQRRIVECERVEVSPPDERGAREIEMIGPGVNRVTETVGAGEVAYIENAAGHTVDTVRVR